MIFLKDTKHDRTKEYFRELLWGGNFYISIRDIFVHALHDAAMFP